MLYGIMVVKNRYTKECGQDRHHLICVMQNPQIGDVLADMIVESTACQENTHYRELSRYFAEGNVLHCEFAYKMMQGYLQLCIVRFKLCKPINLRTGEEISASDYLNPERGYFVYEKVQGEWIDVTNGLLSLYGNTCILLSNDSKHYSYDGVKAKIEEIREENNSFLKAIYNYLSGKK